MTSNRVASKPLSGPSIISTKSTSSTVHWGGSSTQTWLPPGTQWGGSSNPVLSGGQQWGGRSSTGGPIIISGPGRLPLPEGRPGFPYNPGGTQPPVLPSSGGGTGGGGGESITFGGTFETAPTPISITLDGTSSRTGLASRVVTTSTTRKDLGNRIVSMDVLPYMRSRNIEFISKKLKPNTRVHPFFDGQSVAEYIVPKILEVEMISGSFESGETVTGFLPESSNATINQSPSNTFIRFRLATYNHKYGAFNGPSDIYSSNPYNRNIQLQPYSVSSTTLNVDTASLSDLSLGNFGGNVFVGMILIGNRSGASARIVNKRLVTDEIGTVIGSFFVPNPNQSGNPRFSTGNKTFRLTDNPINSDISGTFLTFADATFFSDGLITQSQETYLSLRNIQVQTGSVTETKNVTKTIDFVVPGQTGTFGGEFTLPPTIPPTIPPTPAPTVTPTPGPTVTPTPGPTVTPTPGPTVTPTPGPTVTPTPTPTPTTAPPTQAAPYRVLFVYFTASFNDNYPTFGFFAIFNDSNQNGFFSRDEVFIYAPPEDVLRRFVRGTSPNPSLTVAFGPNVFTIRKNDSNFIPFPVNDETAYGGPNTVGGKLFVWAINVVFSSEATGGVAQNEVGPVPLSNFAATFKVFKEGNVSVLKLLLDAAYPERASSTGSNGYQDTRANNPNYTGTDPLAQTFKIGSDQNQVGRFVTSVDLYFRTKSEDLPLYVELRPVELGTPTSKIYPFSRVEISPSQINVSDDGSVATRIKFHAPVYLEGNKEHALVLLSNSTDYNVYVSRLGETDISTINLPESQRRLVTTQPILGSLFKSQNASTWTPSQYEDLKFTLYAAVFQQTGSVTFFNPELNRTNDQIAVLRNNALDIESRRVRVGLGTTLSTSTISDLPAGSSIIQSDSTVSGDFAYVTGIATGNLSIPNSGIGYTPSAGIQTYNSVPLISITGFGRDATANIVVTNGSITSAGISSGGTGYQVGDILTANVGISSLGRNLRLSVQQLSGFNELVIDNVQGEFEVGAAKSIRYYSTTPGIGFTDLNGGGVFANTIVTERDGLHIKVNHNNHGMHSRTNIVKISNVLSDIPPVKLANTIENDFTGNINVTGLTTSFNTFENVEVSSTNPGYIVINSEIISYTGVSGNSLTGIARGIDSTLKIRHVLNSEIYKYELAGVSLRRINTEHTLQDADDNKEITLDSYFIKIDSSKNGVDRSNNISLPKLYLNSSKSTGGPVIQATQNIQYDIARPIVQTFTPPQTEITASIRSISGTSIGSFEESFLDRGIESLKLNEDNYFDNPRLVCSRINEKTFLNNIMQGNKSMQVTMNLFTVNTYLTPMIDLDRVGMILTSNKVNYPVVNFASDSRVSTLEDDPHSFVYATKPIQLEVPATSIRVIVSAHINIYNDMRAFFAIMKDLNEEPVYYPFPGNGNITSLGKTVSFADNNGRPDLPMKSTARLGFLSEELEFFDYEFSINDLESFRYFSVKLIGASTSQTYPPRFRDLRIIALA